MLLITGDFSASYDKSAKTVEFGYYNDSITLKNFTATTFNVNGFNYKINGSRLVKK